MLKAATYARYSTDMQSETSIEDQLRNCRRHAEHYGIPIVEGYEDKGLSGAISNRPGYQAMLRDAERGLFNVILSDDLSRLGRNAGELARIRDHFAFLQIRIIGVSDGIDTAMRSAKVHAGIKGLFSEMYVDDIREKTHRGLSGKALRGKVAGGRVYGYDNIPIEHPHDKDQYGRPKIIDVEYAINREQAAVVGRIFNWYGREGRAQGWVAKQLNREGIASPHGRGWAPGTIRDMLRNQLYIGEYIWNRTRKIKHHETGARKYIERPKSEWIVTPMPHLRVIDQNLWDAVARRLEAVKHSATGSGGNHTTAPKFLFSGLLKCGMCGSNYAMINHFYYACSTHKNKGTCDNHIRVGRKYLEAILLSRIKESLMTEANFKAFRKRIADIISSHGREDAGAIREVERRMARIDAEIGRMIDAVKSGILSSTLQKELTRAEAQREEMARQLESLQRQNTGQLMDFIPIAEQRYRELIGNLESELARDVAPAREMLKQLFGDEIKLVPHARGLEAQFMDPMEASFSAVVGASLYVPLVPRTGHIQNIHSILIPLPQPRGRI